MLGVIDNTEVHIWVPQDIADWKHKEMAALEAASMPPCVTELADVPMRSYLPKDEGDFFDDFTDDSGLTDDDGRTSRLLADVPLAFLVRLYDGHPRSIISVREGKMSGWVLLDADGMPMMRVEPGFQVDLATLRLALNFSVDVASMKAGFSSQAYQTQAAMQRAIEVINELSVIAVYEPMKELTPERVMKWIEGEPLHFGGQDNGRTSLRLQGGDEPWVDIHDSSVGGSEADRRLREDHRVGALRTELAALIHLLCEGNGAAPCGEDPPPADDAARAFVEHLTAVKDYWVSLGRSAAETADGLLFSTLVTLDGGSVVMPAFDVVPVLCDEDPDDAYGPFRDGAVINGHLQLHELYCSMARETKAGAVPASEILGRRGLSLRAKDFVAGTGTITDDVRRACKDLSAALRRIEKVRAKKAAVMAHMQVRRKKAEGLHG